MKTFGLTLLTAFLLILAASAQVTIAPRLNILGSQPEFLLLTICCLAPLVRPALGGAIGFTGGLLLGGLSGATIAHYIITRTLLGYVLGLSTDLEPNARTIALMTAAGTLINQIVMMFIAPPPNLGAFLQVTIVQALLNGVLAFPLSAGLRKVFRPKVV